MALRQSWADWPPHAHNNATGRAASTAALTSQCPCRGAATRPAHQDQQRARKEAAGRGRRRQHPRESGAQGLCRRNGQAACILSSHDAITQRFTWTINDNNTGRLHRVAAYNCFDRSNHCYSISLLPMSGDDFIQQYNFITTLSK